MRKVSYQVYIYVYASLSPLAQAPLKAKVSSSPMDTCSTCKLVAQLLKGFIDNNKTEVRNEYIHTVVELLAVCNHLQRRADVMTAEEV